MRIKVDVPAKIILFGEWAVLEGNTCIGTTVGSHFTLDAKQSTGASALHTTNIDLGTAENLLESDAWCRTVWQHLNEHLPITEHLDMTTHREWQLHEGLGSSSALFLSLLELREFVLDKELPWKDLLNLFKLIPENFGSGMDLAIQRTRAPIIYKNFIPARFENFRWPRNLILLHGTRKAKSSEEIKKRQISSTQRERLSNSAANFADSEQSTKDWVRAITEHYEVLSEMQIIPPEAKTLFNNLRRDAKILAIKSVGAGGMDGLLVWTEAPEDFSKFNATIEKIGWYHSPYRTNVNASARSQNK